MFDKHVVYVRIHAISLILLFLHVLYRYKQQYVHTLSVSICGCLLGQARPIADVIATIRTNQQNLRRQRQQEATNMRSARRHLIFLKTSLYFWLVFGLGSYAAPNSGFWGIACT